MRMRGNVFWAWADPTLHHRSHDETLDDGIRPANTPSRHYRRRPWCPPNLSGHQF